MIKFKKGLLISIIFALLFSSLPGCGQGFETYEDPMKEETEASPVTKIVFSTWSAAHTAAIKDGIRQYNTTNKDNVMVEYMEIPFDRYAEKLNVLLSSGEGPDVFGLSSEWIEPYARKGWIADLTSQLDDGFLESFPDWAVAIANKQVYRNRFYSIPATEITVRLIYNKQLFEEAGLNPESPPATFEQLIEYANKIGEYGKLSRRYGFALAAGEEWSGFVLAMEIPFAYNGLSYYNEEKGIYDLSVYGSFFEGIRRMKNGGGLFPNELQLKNDSAKIQFAADNIGMMYASNWDMSFFHYQLPLKFDMGIAMPPAFGNKPNRNIQTVIPGVCYAVSDKTLFKRESVEFWKYLYSKEHMELLFESGVEIPIIKGIKDGLEKDAGIGSLPDFLPAEKEKLLLEVPENNNYMMRAKIYKNALESLEQAGEILLEETEKLNDSLMLTDNR